MTRGTRRLVAGAAAVVVAVSAAACSTEEDRVPSIGYAVNGPITTYNAGSTEGAYSAARQALSRVLPGFSMIGPGGTAVADTDIGTVTEVPGQQQVLTYAFAPAAVWSDGVPMTCDDLVLAWAARRGTTEGSGTAFDAAETAGYSDIERIDCVPSQKEATVTFRADRPLVDRESLFGPGTILPAHVAARTAGVPDVTSTLAGGDADAVGRLAEAWNTGWTLPSGAVDPAVFAASGPFRVESFSADDGLVLVPNDNWWGVPAQTDRIVVWPSGIDLAEKASSGDVEVVDLPGGAAAPDGFAAAAQPSFGVEQLIFATSGVFVDPAARRAVASCVPRTALFDAHGHPGYDAETGRGSGVVDSRVMLPGTLPYRSVAAVAADRYRTTDVAAVTAGLAQAGLTDPTVRIGYRGPDSRRAAIVADIAAACGPLGVDVVDASSDTLSPLALRAGEVDVLLAGTAGGFGPTGTATPGSARTALLGGQNVNLGGYANGRVDELLNRLAVDGSDATALSAGTDVERILWDDLPTLPLWNVPVVTATASGMRGVDANPSVAGAGWNMDKWVFVR